MLVEMIARTMIEPVLEDYLPNEYEAEDADLLAEFAGRECYQSFHRPNPATRATADYVQKNLIEKGHASVLEHASVTFRISEVSRSFTHEMVRHRHNSYSQLSQRYVPLDKMDVVIHPTLKDEDLGDRLMEVWDKACEVYDELEKELKDRGYTTKESREAAREVLPNATSTIIVVTGNHRSWRHFLDMRHSPFADKQIAMVAAEILTQLRDVAPAVYQDIPDVDLDKVG